MGNESGGRSNLDLDPWAVEQVALYARQSKRWLSGPDYIAIYDAFVWYRKKYGTPDNPPARRRRWRMRG